jgi:acetoacetyl-CoA synthetase
MKRLEPQPQLYIIPMKQESIDFQLIDRFLEKADANDELTFCRVSFNDPLMICVSLPKLRMTASRV